MEKAFRAKFLDKEIIEKRKEKLKKQYTSLEEGVYMGGEIREFERQEILGIISAMMPEDFVVMPEDYIRTKYTSTFGPQYITSNLDLNVNMGFSIFPDNLKDRNVQHVAERTREILDSEDAGLDFGSCEKLENIEGYWFDFRNHAMEQDVYNILLITIVEEKILQVTFNCQIQEQLDWKPVVLQIFETIEPIRERRRI